MSENRGPLLEETAERYFGSWLLDLKRRKPFNVALVALANKLAKIAWSVMTSHKPFELRVYSRFAYGNER